MKRKGIAFLKTNADATLKPTSLVFAPGRCTSHPVPLDQELRRRSHKRGEFLARSFSFLSALLGRRRRDASWMLQCASLTKGRPVDWALGFRELRLPAYPVQDRGRLLLSALAVSAKPGSRLQREEGTRLRAGPACPVRPNHCKQAEAGAG